MFNHFNESDFFHLYGTTDTHNDRISSLWSNVDAGIWLHILHADHWN